jgi:flagellar assembly protein FliH
LKKFYQARAELYHFPSEEDLALMDEPTPEEEEEPIQEEELLSEPEQSNLEPPKEESPIEYAKIQADAILRDARQQAEEILAEARRKAEEEAEAIKAAARETGRREGYMDGVAQAEAEGLQRREEQAALLEGEVQTFLDQATEKIEGAMDAQVNDLRDLAIAVAEKVVCISLKSSSEVIARMIQTAIDKRKKKEWVRIYIAECDARRMTQVPESLTSALSALSDRVRIIPVTDDESGTCIIEMPDEIVDASASTQLNNLRSMLMDLPDGGGAPTFDIRS